MLPKWTAVGGIAVANAILMLLVPKPPEDDSVRSKATESQKELLKKIDLTGLLDGMTTKGQGNSQWNMPV